MMERRQFVQCGGLLLAVQLVGCGGEDGDSGESGTGGTNQGTGGDTATGGTTNATGGTTSTGGTGGSTGGTTSTGGADQGTGGSTGGSMSTGGEGNMGDSCTGDLEGASSTDFGHDHVFTLPLAVIMAGQATTLTLEMDASNGSDTEHEHAVELTADDLATLQAGGTVTKTSDGQHQHDVTLSCAG